MRSVSELGEEHILIVLIKSMKGSDVVLENIRKQKEGFSLIELIIAIAILVIFVGIVSLSTALLRRADTKGLASGVNDSLTDLKALTEAHTGPFYLHIYKNDNGYYAYYDENIAFTAPGYTDPPVGERIGSSSLGLLVSYDGSSAEDVTEEKTVTIQMQKKDGAYKDLIKKNESGADELVKVAPRYFLIKLRNRLDYKVVLAKATGLHYMEQF